MRPPYLLCKRHCQHWDRCALILQTFAEQHALGKPHPLSLILQDGCQMFQMPGPVP